LRAAASFCIRNSLKFGGKSWTERDALARSFTPTPSERGGAQVDLQPSWFKVLGPGKTTLWLVRARRMHTSSTKIVQSPPSNRSEVCSPRQQISDVDLGRCQRCPNWSVSAMIGFTLSPSRSELPAFATMRSPSRSPSRISISMSE